MNIFKMISACLIFLISLTTGSAEHHEGSNQVKPPLAGQMAEPSMGDIRSMLEEAGLGNYWGTLEKHIRPGFYMAPTMVDEDAIQLGTSKIGGHPDVPSTFQWPSWKHHPMSFVAQINLAEFPMNEIDSEYPASGILYFFYVYDPDLWYDDPRYDNDKMKNNLVYYTTDTSELIRMEPPKGLLDPEIFKSALLKKKLELTIPDSDYVAENKLIRNKGDLDKYSLGFWTDFMETYHREIGFRFLGHMTPLQYGGHPSDQLLLFQADSSDEIGMNWDLSGLLYFFIREDDFKKAFFENVYTERVGT
ncbi:DUF1963 domain-containing protein [Paenibacillus sp. sgz5001063]|uniref:DUF1963 domain-containing protein n=1 Tax=Paenibacillus sp. sgz5001063 TaxID=3242474 RepID=UPI0036D27B87